MITETVRSSEACRLLRELEEVLETSIMTVVAVDNKGELSFIFPAGMDEENTAMAIVCIRAACQNALKSL